MRIIGATRFVGCKESGTRWGAQSTDDTGTLAIESRNFQVTFQGTTYQLASNPYRTLSDSTMGWTRTRLDKNGRVQEVETFAGGTKPFPWDANGNSSGVKKSEYHGDVTYSRDEALKWTYHTADAFGRLTGVTEDPGGLSYVTSYAYDAIDNLRQVTQGAQTRTFSSSSLKRLTSANNPETGLISYTYDDNGNVLTKSDPRGVTVTTGYNSRNQIVSRTYAGGLATPPVSYAYDSCAFGLGRLCSVSSSASSTTYTYDNRGRIVASTQTTDGASYPFTYQYNLADGLKRIVYPSQRQVDYAYSNAGRVTTVTGLMGGVTANYTKAGQTIAYAPHGATASLPLENGVTETWSYNNRLQVTGISAGSLWSIVNNYGTTNNNGNVLSQTTGGGTRTYLYDGVNLWCAKTQSAITQPPSPGRNHGAAHQAPASR